MSFVSSGSFGAGRIDYARCFIAISVSTIPLGAPSCDAVVLLFLGAIEF